MTGAKPWFLSKTIITSGLAFGVAVATSSGVLDVETGTKIQGLLIPLVLTFLRVGNKELT
jgi:hypothetical protein